MIPIDSDNAIVSVLTTLSPGTRFWHLYRSEPDLIEFAGLFLRAGLQGNQRCVCLGDAAIVSGVHAALGQLLPDFAARCSDGDFIGRRISAAELRGNFIHPNLAIAEMNALYDQARADGYVGVRLLVDWNGLGQVTRSDLAAYERAVAQALTDRPGVIACAYPLDGPSVEDVFNVSQAHSLLTVNRLGAWALFTDAQLHRAGFSLRQIHERLDRALADQAADLQISNAALRQAIAARERAERDLQDHVWFLEGLDRINRAMHGANDLETMMREVLDTLLDVFKSDRAWMVYPCDPESPTWTVPMERTRPEYPGVLPVGVTLPLDPNGAAVFRLMRATDGPLMFGPGAERPVPPEAEQGFGIKSFLVQALYPRVGLPWSFGLHQCSHARQWTPVEARLLQEVGRRMADTLTTLLTIRDLRVSESELAKAQQLAHIGHWEHDLETNRLFGSEETQRIIGLAEQTDGIDFAMLLERIHPDDRHRVEACVAKAMHGEESASVEYRLIRPDGGQTDIFGQWNATLDASGKPRRLFGTVQDITERRRAEEDRRTLSHAVEQSPVSIIITDTTGAIEYVNPKFTQASGYTRDEAIGRNPRLLRSDETSADEYRQLWQTILQGGTWRGEFHNRRKDGSLYWESASISPVLDDNGRVAHFVAIKEDITERKRSEEALAHRLAELEAVVEISSALRTTQDRSDLQTVILERLSALLRADGAAFAMRDSTSYETELESAIGLMAAARRARFATGEGVSGRAVLTGEFHLDNATDLGIALARPEWRGQTRALVCAPLIAQAERIGVLWLSRLEPFSDHEARLIAAIADIAANAIKRATLMEQSQRDALNIALAYEDTIEGWSRALDLRDHETEGHSLRVTDLTVRLAQEAGLPEEEIAHVRRGALLHDIGKMGVPDAILLKPGPLNATELEIMRRHPMHAYNMLAPIAYLRPALDIPQRHHEKWDGTGYPDGLRGDTIPFAARLFAIVDVWDALTSDRPYRAAWTPDRALAYIHEQRGRHFDPDTVDLFLKVLSRGA